jgi:hypothetical protein
MKTKGMNQAQTDWLERLDKPISEKNLKILTISQ